MGTFSYTLLNAVVGGLVAQAVVWAMTQHVRQSLCPHCGRGLGKSKPGERTHQQVMLGGWTCPNCGCDVDRRGKERGSSATITAEIEALFSSDLTYRNIIRRPDLLLLRPALLVTRPWLLVPLCALTSCLVGIAKGIYDGAPAGIGSAVEGCLVGGFVGLVIGSMLGLPLACFFWLLGVFMQRPGYFRGTRSRG